MELFERQTIICSESDSGSSGGKMKQNWGWEVKRWADQEAVEENDGPHSLCREGFCQLLT